MGELFPHIRNPITRRRFDAQLVSDMESHREMAARAGRSNFGNTLRMARGPYLRDVAQPRTKGAPEPVLSLPKDLASETWDRANPLEQMTSPPKRPYNP
jgi:hypothetical protein